MKRFKNHSGFGPGYVGLPYQTIKVVNVPERGDLVPGQDPPEPTPENLPHGDTEDYQSYILRYWLDKQEPSRREGTELFKQKFPVESASYETIRKRHVGSLQRLVKKYGLKPASEIVRPDFKVQRRGRQTGNKYSTIGVRALEPTTATHEAASALGETAVAGQHASTMPSLWTQSPVNGGSTEQARVREVIQPLATRGFL